MPLSDEIVQARVAYYRALIESIIAGKRWIVADGILVSGARMGENLVKLGADKVLVVAGSRGTGEVAEAEGMEALVLGLEAPDLMTSIRMADQLLSNLPDHALQTIDAFDPTGEAQALGTIWLTGQTIAGRPLLGCRPSSWQAYESKMVADALWKRVGIQHAPHAIVPAALDPLRAAAAKLDQGMGTVWVGDNREGWHGGATMLRWIRSDADMAPAAEFLAAHCAQARVMPFLDGIPCSIHAFVTEDEVRSVRPCEMLVYRQEDTSSLHYAGAATNWIPSETQSAQMHDAVRRVGTQIRAEVGYRGSFTLDGICNQDGFFPTEINPRYGGALGRMSASMPDLPLYLIHTAIASGIQLDYRLEELVDLIASEAHSKPMIRAMALLPGVTGMPEEKLGIARSDEGWETTEDEAPLGTIEIGPSPTGSIIFAKLETEAVPHGDSAAPALGEVLMFACRHWGLELPSLTAAPDLR
jgi:hypothetical protein